MLARTVLAQGAIFEIVATGKMVTLEIVNRGDVTAEEGARCANQMNDVLTSRVLSARSPYRGVLVDVRNGPRAFGPKTRAALERVFAAATVSQRRIAVLASDSPTQRMQFSNLCVEHAKMHGRVFFDEPSARQWLTS
jgi:hypothetical protein